MQRPSHIRFCLILALLLIFSDLYSQEDKSKRASPPAIEEMELDDLKITIAYSRPSVKGRKIWGGLVPYGKVWRTGANEATTFEINRNVVLDGQNLPAGKFGLFTIPGEDEWTIIFNEVWDQWGAYGYDAGRDILRIKVMPDKTDEFTEMMTFEIDEDGEIELYWENLEVKFKVKLVD